jgi:hypothetical protein
MVHALLFVYDLNNPKTYLLGDRAYSRFDKIESLLQARNDQAIADFLINTGSLGDYIFHAVIFAWGGVTTIIVVQILLHLVSIVYVFLLGELLFRNSMFSLLAAAVYAFLPASLYHPHVLVSEALFNPLVVVAFYYGALFLAKDDAPPWHLMVTAFAGSVAAFIRPIYVGYPIVYACILVLLVKRPARYLQAIVYLAVAFAIPFLWAGFVFVQTGDFSMGKSDHDLGFNLFGRVERMSRLGNFELTQEQQAIKRLQFREYTDYIVEHPNAYFKTLVSDVYNVTLNSGVNSLLGRYLGWYRLPEEWRYWRLMRDKYGILGMVQAMYDYSQALFIFNVILAPIWLAFTVLALIGIIRVLKIPTLSISIRFIMVAS